MRQAGRAKLICESRGGESVRRRELLDEIVEVLAAQALRVCGRRGGTRRFGQICLELASNSGRDRREGPGQPRALRPASASAARPAEGRERAGRAFSTWLRTSTRRYVIARVGRRFHAGLVRMTSSSPHLCVTRKKQETGRRSLRPDLAAVDRPSEWQTQGPGQPQAPSILGQLAALVGWPNQGQMGLVFNMTSSRVADAEDVRLVREGLVHGDSLGDDVHLARRRPCACGVVWWCVRRWCDGHWTWMERRRVNAVGELISPKPVARG